MSGPAWGVALTAEEAAENNGPRVLIIGWIFTAKASLFVAGRIFSRLKKLARLGTGDYIVLVSLTLSFLYMALITVAVDSGLGRHISTLATPQAHRALLFTTIGFVPGILSYTMPKFAVVILIKDLLRPSRLHVMALWALAAVNAVLTVLCITFTYVQCEPPSALWTTGIVPRCWDPLALIATSIASGATSALFDFWFALYPAAVLWRMQINLKKKVALITALGLGVCAGIVAVYKCTTFETSRPQYNDLTFTSVNIVIWTTIEANAVIISACIPMLMPFVELVFGENFLRGGVNGQLPTIRSSSEPAASSET
ncbi:4b21163e-68a6-4bdd-8da7-29f53bda3888 [Thermothielavioides terrestris]|uniref:4b21163e-68a6-4bdd-8da7-29f53bda3888 n=1 Tax=Thermothielavioides terrestris TaxID=2587410 RepID=A0A3S4AXS3_9PEZI|nr:4b21163e-68a6-4bdd-8da7-29f53bda3888 [Thermothielavioides terrestris]